MGGASRTERFDLVAERRRALADALEGLTPEQWGTPSLCAGWTVRDVAVHVMVGPTSGMREVLVAMARSRGSFDRANRVMVENRAGLSDAEVVAVMRERAESRFVPPMMTWHAPLTDVLVHTQDVAVPLGIAVPSSAEAWRHALEYLLTPAARRAFTGDTPPSLTYAVDDLDLTLGSGPRVEGSAAALVLALCRRTALLDDLTGPGADVLRAWAPR